MDDSGARDEAVNVYAGGGISVTGEPAEMEGRIVTPGSLSVAKSRTGIYNVGVAGVGSKVSPPGGSDHVIVGADVTVASRNTLAADGGAIRFAGVQRGEGEFRAQMIHDAAAMDSYQGVDAALTQRSQCLARQPTTGTVRFTGWDVTFVGDGTSDVQVFEVESSLVAPGGGSLDIAFEDIPEGSTILINLMADDVRISTYSGDLVDASAWNSLREKLLWNFPNAQAISLGGFGQFQGSLLAGSPGNTVTLAMPGFNGRLFTVGNLVHTSDANGGVGGEIHAYPFTGKITRCEPEPPIPSVPPTPPDRPQSKIGVSKKWVVNDVEYVEGDQPRELVGTLTLDHQTRQWDEEHSGPAGGGEVVLDETTVLGGGGVCVLDSARITELNGDTVDLPVPSPIVVLPGGNHATVTNTVTCAPRLTLVKRVVEGDRPPSDWTLEAASVDDGFLASDAHRVTGSYDGVTVPVLAGRRYALTEDGPDDGYWLEALRCDVGPDRTFVDTTEVTLGPLEEVTCVFLNTNQESPERPRGSEPKLTLVKMVENGTTGAVRVPTDWFLTARGPVTISGVVGSDEVTEASVAAGTYRLSEAGPDGYDNSAWSCDGATASTADSVTIDLDQHAVCTITNTARPTPPSPEPSEPPVPPTTPPVTPQPSTTSPMPPPASPSTTPPVSGSESPPGPTVSASRGGADLARTGTDIVPVAVVALALIVVGGLFVVRRHRGA